LKPQYEPVWVFRVQFRLRVITLKKRFFKDNAAEVEEQYRLSVSPAKAEKKEG